MHHHGSVQKFIHHEKVIQLSKSACEDCLRGKLTQTPSHGLIYTVTYGVTLSWPKHI